MISSDAVSQGRLAAALSCFGLMADIYDLNIVNLVRPILEDEFGIMTPKQDALLTGAALAGALIGMLGFGLAADYIGRRCLFITTAALVGVASIACACAGPCLGLHVYTVLAIWRFVLGLGLGGEYPLAAANTVENTDSASSARALAFVFCGMAAGQLLAPAVVMTLAGVLDIPGQRLWRWAFGFGAVMALLVAALRYYHLRETNRWAQAEAPRRIRDQVPALAEMKYSLAGTAGAWLLYDVVTYGVSLYSTTIFPAEPGLASAKVVFLINAIMIPGYAGAVFFSSRSPARHMQLYGLIGMTICFGFMVSMHVEVTTKGAVFLLAFGLMRCIDAMGPGYATFAIPGQIYPTRIRATAHGMSAAAGKLGAVLGTAIFPYVLEASGLQVVMALMAGTSMLAAAWTILFTPSYNEQVLEDIANLDSSMPLVQQAATAESLLFNPKKQQVYSFGLGVLGSYGSVPQQASQ
jgi:PHS family inorganic phosphate transporter-like MFS transporter|mmetsp:Transcript_35123/g.54554  ORF Transcript_35123/g.54554 Transcript_35123/m.54554 type:complete len:466 (-) Transcript_35123:21-1418(-)